jgi:putative membrane protein insertion efficiency factor
MLVSGGPAVMSAARSGIRLLHLVKNGVSALVASALIAMIRAYQIAVRPLLIGSCRFVPSCSDYFIEAVRTHGCIRGTLMGLWRVCRCNPFSIGGLDPVPPPSRSNGTEP